MRIMENNEINYTPEFYEALNHCKKNHLFFGEGTPTAEILIIGKECGFNTEKKARLSNKEGVDLENEILQISKEEADSNLYRLENKCPLPKHVNYNPTWKNYQDLTNKIMGLNKSEWGSFLDDSFITEFSQVQLPYSNFLKEKGLTDRIRKESINKREALFSLPFFRSFPVVILACGHYPTRDFVKDYNYKFDIEKTFKVKWQYPIRDIKEEEKYPACWYNIHYNEDFESIGINRVVIHTRQLSRIFNPRLLNEIAREIHLLGL